MEGNIYPAGILQNWSGIQNRHSEVRPHGSVFDQDQIKYVDECVDQKKISEPLKAAFWLVIKILLSEVA